MNKLLCITKARKQRLSHLSILYLMPPLYLVMKQIQSIYVSFIALQLLVNTQRSITLFILAMTLVPYKKNLEYVRNK